MSSLYFALVVEPGRARVWLKYGISGSDDPSARLDAHARYAAFDGPAWGYNFGASKASLVALFHFRRREEAAELESAIKRTVARAVAYRCDTYGRGRPEWIPMDPAATQEDAATLAGSIVALALEDAEEAVKQARDRVRGLKRIAGELKGTVA